MRSSSISSLSWDVSVWKVNDYKIVKCRRKKFEEIWNFLFSFALRDACLVGKKEKSRAYGEMRIRIIIRLLNCVDVPAHLTRAVSSNSGKNCSFSHFAYIFLEFVHMDISTVRNCHRNWIVYSTCFSKQTTDMINTRQRVCPESKVYNFTEFVDQVAKKRNHKMKITTGKFIHEEMQASTTTTKECYPPLSLVLNHSPENFNTLKSCIHRRLNENERRKKIVKMAAATKHKEWSREIVCTFWRWISVAFDDNLVSTRALRCDWQNAAIDGFQLIQLTRQTPTIGGAHFSRFSLGFEFSHILGWKMEIFTHFSQHQRLLHDRFS